MSPPPLIGCVKGSKGAMVEKGAKTGVKASEKGAKAGPKDEI